METQPWVPTGTHSGPITRPIDNHFLGVVVIQRKAIGRGARKACAHELGPGPSTVVTLVPCGFRSGFFTEQALMGGLI